MIDSYNNYVMENYDKKPTFSSFLPGLVGRLGIPVWAFYCNRGQAITSFGSENKDNSIMEFYPAQTAHQLTKTHGFRTFVRINGAYRELFALEKQQNKMTIGLNFLRLDCDDEQAKLHATVRYFTLPNERLGGLGRIVEIKKTSDVSIKLDVLDGMPALVPYGVSLSDLKDMGQTVKAWMQVEDVETKIPYYRVRASIVDSIDVQEIRGGNYAFSFNDKDELLYITVDADNVFGYDSAMINAVNWRDGANMEDMVDRTSNKVPCAFFSDSRVLESGDTITLYELYGKSDSKDLLLALTSKIKKAPSAYFEEAWQQACSLTDEVVAPIAGKTGNEMFDAYSKATFMDNALRGGFPIKIADKMFYIYSRKHGDIERDYNAFSMSPEFYTQGNANFRDICQNRRSDIFYAPETLDMNIKMFASLIQTDGFNPLHIKQASYRIDKDALSSKSFGIEITDELRNIVTKSYTPGSLALYLIDNNLAAQDEIESIIEAFVSVSKTTINSDFGEGYWTDHWEYIIDLIEAYLRVYPDKVEELLFEDEGYTYFDTTAIVNRRDTRYVKTPKGLRQYNAITMLPRKASVYATDENESPDEKKLMHTRDGRIYKTNLAEKLLLLCVTKFLQLDSHGMGIEMEGGRPGWYDALNGLPGLFGSSMCETIEVCRHIEFLTNVIRDSKIRKLDIAEELSNLISEISKQELKTWNGMATWNALNDIKEEYREVTRDGYEGRKVSCDADTILSILDNMHSIILEGLNRAREMCDGKMPSYFAYEATIYEEAFDGKIEVKSFKPITIPLFLEGYVHLLRLEASREEKIKVYEEVRNSALFDRQLSMYKVNESLANASFELGRTKAFTPGWLENESIWLHMEYKYLLELLKSGLYEQFISDFKDCCVCFLDENTYGRSPLENSSFIASSANPDESIHGRGFVARLSGSTAEFIDIWNRMMFGNKLFERGEEGLEIALEPLIPEYLIGEDLRVEATFLANTKVVYLLEMRKNYIPGEYILENIYIEMQDGNNYTSSGFEISDNLVRDIRDGKAKEITIKLL